MIDYCELRQEKVDVFIGHINYVLLYTNIVKVSVRSRGVKSPLLTRLQAVLYGAEPMLLNYSVVARCIQALVVLFFLLIIQCKAIHGARIKNASTSRTVEKKDNI